MVSRLGPRSGLFTGQHLLNQRSEDRVVHRCELQQADIQPLELTFGHRVEIGTTNTLLRTSALQPPQKDLGCARVADRPLTQATLNLRVTRRLPVTPVGAAAQPRRARDSEDRGGTPSADRSSPRRRSSSISCPAIETGEALALRTDPPEAVAKGHAQAGTNLQPQPQTAILQPQLEPHRPKARALAGLSLIGSSR